MNEHEKWMNSENEDKNNFYELTWFFKNGTIHYRKVLEILEEEEPDEFWASLGGKGDYATTRDLPSRPLLQTRLFKLSNETGKFIVEEICNFVQEVFILTFIYIILSKFLIKLLYQITKLLWFILYIVHMLTWIMEMSEIKLIENIHIDTE